MGTIKMSKINSNWFSFQLYLIMESKKIWTSINNKIMQEKEYHK